MEEGAHDAPVLPEECLVVLVAHGGEGFSMLHWVICLLTIELLEFLLNILEIKP